MILGQILLHTFTVNKMLYFIFLICGILGLVQGLLSDNISSRECSNLYDYMFPKKR